MAVGNEKGHACRPVAAVRLRNMRLAHVESDSKGADGRRGRGVVAGTATEVGDARARPRRQRMQHGRLQGGEEVGGPGAVEVGERHIADQMSRSDD